MDVTYLINTTMNLVPALTKLLGKLLLILLVSQMLPSPILAQELPKKFLLLKRGANQKTQIRFYPGENITYKSKRIGYFVTDKIVNLDTDFYT